MNHSTEALAAPPPPPRRKVPSRNVSGCTSDSGDSTDGAPPSLTLCLYGIDEDE